MEPPSQDRPVSLGKRYSLWHPACGLGENRENALRNKPFQYLLERYFLDSRHERQADFGLFGVFLKGDSVWGCEVRDDFDRELVAACSMAQYYRSRTCKSLQIRKSFDLQKSDRKLLRL